MYFRLTRTKSTPVLQLVRGYRNKRGKVCQEIVVSLGNMPVPADYRKEIAQELENRLSGQESLFPIPAYVGKWVDIILKKIDEKKRWASRIDTSEPTGDEEVADGVLVDRIEHENETELGPALVLKRAWDELGIGNFLKASGFRDPQIKAAMVSVFNRLIEPCSEHELPDWVQTVSLEELLGGGINRYGDDRYYRVSDRLLELRIALERHLREREETLFNLKSSIVLYDLTNSYFEGECRRNPKAKRGHSKEKRSDCPLLSLGLIIDRAGFIIGHEVLEGNRHDCRTLVEMVACLESRLPDSPEKAVIVVDGGIATEENLKYLRENGYHYIVAAKRQSRNEFYEDFCDADSFSAVPDRELKKPVFVKRIEEDDELLVLCRSDSRRDKEDAILSKTEEKFINALNNLDTRLKSPKSRLKKTESIYKSIGRLHQQYSRAAKYYEVSYDEKKRTVSWSRNEKKYSGERKLHGCYFLRSSMKEISDHEVWNIYVSLTRVEQAFRNMKSELGLRPFRHHREDRCDAHAWITVLAYHLMRWIEHTLELAGAPATWRSVRRLLQTHCYSTIIVPSKDGKIRFIRRAGRPDERQRKIYQILNVEYRNLPVIKHTNFKFL
jgi:transposase